MGNTLDSSDPGQRLCSLCQSPLADAVTLKQCQHRFCRRCIGDLWSGSRTGPYYCPEWRCKTEYRTLPFSQTPPSGGGSATAAAAANRPGWSMGTSSLLGKRKSSSAAPEQPPAPKRPAPGESPDLQEPMTSSPTAGDAPPTTTPLSQSAADGDLSRTVKQEEPVEIHDSEDDDGGDDGGTRSSSDSGCDDVELLNNDVPQDSDSDTHLKVQPQPHADEQSGDSSEVDMCDASSSPTRSTRGSPGMSPASVPPSRSTTHSPPGKDQPSSSPPVLRLSLSPGLLAKRPTATTPSSSPHRITLASPRGGSDVTVVCHYCPSSRQQCAVKTCLVCGASMCSEHLRPHLDSPVFQSHTLVPPVEDTAPWRCQEHQEMNRIYCRPCAVCVCTVCTVIGTHRGHACISIREAERELRVTLKDDIKHLQENEQTLVNRVTQLKHQKQQYQTLLQTARADVSQQYVAMREALEQEESTALQCVEREERRCVGGVEETLCSFQSSLSSVQQGLHSLETLADAKGEQRLQEQAFIMEYSKVAQILSDMVDSGVDSVSQAPEVDAARLSSLQKWTEKRLDNVVISLPDRDPYRLLYGTVPVLDVDTANPKLLLSADNRTVTHTELQQAYAEQGARFSSFPQILASSPVTGGRCYWEVRVSSDEGRWKVGLCEAQMGRKGQKDGCRLGFNTFSWCLSRERGKVEACHDKMATSVGGVAADTLQTVGVFLDFEEGVLSFYSVTPGGALVLLHCFRHGFSEALYPALSVYKTHLHVCDLFSDDNN